LRARISIITSAVLRDEGAAYDRITQVLGAAVDIRTRDRRTQTLSAQAHVPLGTQVLIITRSLKGGVRAAHARLAGVLGARVLIGAIKGLGACADSIGAHVLDGAGISVIAKAIERLMGAAHGHFTRVIGAGVLIITAVHRPSATHASLAVVVDRADLTVLARLALDGVTDSA
jgi:hypothetical protein